MMRYDRDIRSSRGMRPDATRSQGYESDYHARPHGWGMGYIGGALRSRGSYQAGQLRSGLNPRDEFEFEWGDGYVGGRGYGGTNYDLEHGYQVGSPMRALSQGGGMRRMGGESSPATRGGYAWGEWDEEQSYGPSRYGFGPYHERLQRKRRADDEIRSDVEEALFYDTWVDADRIDIDVGEGIVTLKGTLVDFNEVRYATDDAWDVEGVRGVRVALDVDESQRERPAMRAGAAGSRVRQTGAAAHEGGEAQTQSEEEREAGATGV